MAGTKEGGLKAAVTNKIKHGKDFYAEIGRKGGKNGHTGGFASNPELAKIAGRKGGLKSRRGFHYAYKYIQVTELNTKNFKDFTLSHCKYQNFDAEFQVQTLNHTIHRFDTFYDESCEVCEFGLKFYLPIDADKIYTIAELCGEGDV